MCRGVKPEYAIAEMSVLGAGRHQVQAPSGDALSNLPERLTVAGLNLSLLWTLVTPLPPRPSEQAFACMASGSDQTLASRGDLRVQGAPAAYDAYKLEIFTRKRSADLFFVNETEVMNCLQDGSDIPGLFQGETSCRGGRGSSSSRGRLRGAHDPPEPEPSRGLNHTCFVIVRCVGGSRQGGCYHTHPAKWVECLAFWGW